MPRQYLIIDGYNLLHAAGLARRRYGPRGLELARGRLVGFLSAHLRETERDGCTVVFDAWDAPPGAQQHQHQQGIAVEFAPPGTDADSHIERLLSQHSAPRQVTVVSGDRRLLDAARRRRATGITSDDFYDRLIRRAAGTGHAAAGTTLPAPPPTEDVEFWLREFGYSNERETLAGDPAEPASDKPADASETLGEAPSPPKQTPPPEPERPPLDAPLDAGFHEEWIARLQDEVDRWQREDG